MIVSTGAGSATREPLAQHRDEMRGLARRRGESETDGGGGDAGRDTDVTFVRKRERHFDDAEPATREPSRQLVDEPVHRERERLVVFDRRRQLDLSRVARWRHEWRSRVGDKAAQAVEENDEVRTDASRQRSARQCARLAEGCDAGGGERGDDRGIDIGKRERQRRERIGKIGEEVRLDFSWSGVDRNR